MAYRFIFRHNVLVSIPNAAATAFLLPLCSSRSSTIFCLSDTIPGATRPAMRMATLWLLVPMAGLWSMDRSTAFNFMISRPVVVAAVIGALCGNFGWCLFGGVIFEISGLTDLPVGTRISKDDTFGAFVYSYITSMMPEITLDYAIFTALIAYVLVFPATYTIVFIRWINKQLYIRYPGREGFLIVSGQVIAFIRGVVVYLGGAVLVNAVLRATYGHIMLPGVSMLIIVAGLALFAGYFSGFLHDSLRVKTALLIAGGVFSWLVL